LGGHKFLEIGPTLAHKGRTVDYLLDRYPWPGALPIYLGDDDKDEKAFGVIARGQRDDGLPDIISALAEKVRSTIERNRDILAAPSRKEDRSYRINQALGRLARPGVLISCSTSHLGSPIVTPSAETG